MRTAAESAAAPPAIAVVATEAISQGADADHHDPVAERAR